mmetsp:Transcript_21606/g.34876  ORF Transcript_21606/g.34876 Transcript_21606/m.34876 type:complete len:97 (+) Transcript_21606:965-1255(+)
MGGVWTVAYGLMGFVTMMKPECSNILKCMGALMWCWYLGFHVMTQVALAGPGLYGSGAQLALLFTAVSVALPYFAHEIEKALSLEQTSNTVGMNKL